MSKFVEKNARSVANKTLPPIPSFVNDESISLLLFYAYCEPTWTKKEHKAARKKVLEIGERHLIHGRGRCAREGLNCTMTGTPANIRAFCTSLRDWKPHLFESTDFKIDDTLKKEEHFKLLTVRKVDELVAYKLNDSKTHHAPSLKRSAGTHVEADEFHAMLEEEDKKTIVLDVRNVYESTVGHFQPTGKSVEFLPIPMQNSSEFAPWLNDPKTKKKLEGKRVMMYCTGGIRCERASALLNEMTETDPSFNTNGVFELRGGIHRYMTAYPEGGHWVGKNYVFDKRRVQVPSEKVVPDHVLSVCSACTTLCDEYRGEYKCSDCRCPILVCDTCRHSIERGDEEAPDPTALQCDLCRVGYVAPVKRPKLKRKRSTDLTENSGGSSIDNSMTKRNKNNSSTVNENDDNKDENTFPRLYVAKLPFMTTFKEIQTTLSAAIDCKASKIKYCEFKYDRNTKLFYGTSFVLLKSFKYAQKIVEAGNSMQGIVMKGKRIKINFAPLKTYETVHWPNDAVQEERPALPQ